MDDIKRPAPRPQDTPPAPDESVPVAVNSEEPIDIAPAPDTSTPPVEPTASEAAPAPVVSAPKPGKGGARLVATVLIGVMVALVLIGLAYFATSSTPDEELQPAADTVANDSQLDTTSPVDSAALDSEHTELQQTVNTDEQTDFPDEELTDDQLGL